MLNGPPTYSRGWVGRFNTKVIFRGMMFLITNKRYDVRPSEFYNGTSTIPPTHRKYTRCSVDTKTLVCHILFNKSRMWCWWMRETIYPALVSIIFFFNFPSYWWNVWAFWRLNICYYDFYMYIRDLSTLWCCMSKSIIIDFDIQHHKVLKSRIYM